MPIHHHEVKKHGLEPSHVTTVTLVCEAERAISWHKSENTRKLRASDLKKLIFITTHSKVKSWQQWLRGG
jgi:hypothetical protein